MCRVHLFQAGRDEAAISTSAPHGNTCQTDDAITLSLRLDPGALEAVWLAIRMLEDSEVALSYLADVGLGRDTRLAAVARGHADEVRRAAEGLRGEAHLAQVHVTAQRLDSERHDHGLKAITRPRRLP